MVLDFFVFSFNNLRRRGLRSWLTMLGIFIGIAAVVSLISLGQGLQVAIEEQFEQIGSDKVIIQPRGRIGPPGSETSGNILTLDDLEVVRDVRGVKNVVAILTKTAKIEFNDEVTFRFISSIPEEGKPREVFEGTQAFEILQGRNLKNKDKFKVVVGYNYAFRNIFDKPVKLRDKLIIQDQEFKVIGILEKVGNPFDDGSVVINEEVMRDLYSIPEENSAIFVQVEKDSNLDNVVESIEDELRKFRDEEEGKETFEVRTPEQLLGAIATVFSIVTAVLAGIAAISLLVGGIGIANTMYTSVLERTREIGIMKAVGAKNSDILTIFLIESSLLGLVGGLIGIAIGIGIGEGVEYIAAQTIGTPLLRASFGLPLLLGALIFSFVIGSISGFLPARRAASLKPVEALRYE